MDKSRLGIINFNFLLPSSYCCRTLTAKGEGDSLCLLSSLMDLSFRICKSVRVRYSLLVLSAFWHSINMHFVICLEICQHSKHCDNPFVSGFIHLARLQYFDCKECVHVSVFLPAPVFNNPLFFPFRSFVFLHVLFVPVCEVKEAVKTFTAV